jgi:hypothetical protein
MRTVRAGLVVLAMILGCSKGDGLSDYERAHKTETDAATALREAGGELEQKQYTFQGRQGDAWVVALKGMQITDDTFGRLKALGRISELDLSKSTITDDQLEKVNEMGTFIFRMDLSHTAVTDAGLDHLTSMRALTDLNLAGTKVTPAAIERLKERRRNDPLVPALLKNTIVKTQ